MLQMCCISLDVWGDLANNVIAEFIAAGIIFAVAWWLFRRKNRSGLIAFFGVSTSKRVAVYVSDVLVRSGGSIGTGGIPKSYQGHAVPFGEGQTATLFQTLFRSPIPGLSDQPGLMKHILLSDVQVTISLAQPFNSIDVSATIVATGSPGYNEVSNWAEQHLQPMVRFSPNNDELTTSTAKSYKSNPFTAFVQRLWDKSSNRPVFYAAGLNELGTMGAMYHLISRWNQLQSQFGDSGDFAIIIEVNPLDFRESKIVEAIQR